MYKKKLMGLPPPAQRPQQREIQIHISATVAEPSNTVQNNQLVAHHMLCLIISCCESYNLYSKCLRCLIYSCAEIPLFRHPTYTDLRKIVPYWFCAPDVYLVLRT